MQSIRIAFRNVNRQRKRSLLLGGAIAFGFFIVTLINGFTGGLLDTVETNLANLFGGHIYVSGTEVSERGSEIDVIRNTAAIEEALAVIEDRATSYNTRSAASTTLIFGAREESQLLIGVDYTQEQDFLDSLDFIAGSPEAFLANDAGLLLPEFTIAKLGIEIGEGVIVKATTINGQVNIGDFVVVGSLESQDNFGFASGYAHLAALNALLDMAPDQYQTFNIYLDDLSAIETATDALYQELARRAVVAPRGDDNSDRSFARAFGFGAISLVDEAERWDGTKFVVSNLNDNLEGVMALVNVMETIGLIIFLIILAIIMVGVMNSYRMVMIERTAEIGTMRAMGVHKSGIRNIFIGEAFFIAFGGAIIGLILAGLVMTGLGFIDFGRTNFAFFLDQGHLRFAITPTETLRNIALLCIMSVAAVYSPARAAAQLKPAEALRASY